MIHYLHPELMPHAEALVEIVDYALEHNPEPEKLTELIEEDEAWQRAYAWAEAVLLQNRVAALGGNLFAVPFLHPDYALYLAAKAKRLGETYGHRPNPVEEGWYQIPEIVLRDADRELHAEVAGLQKYLNAWFALIFQTVPKDISSLQFARYTPDDTAHGNWHHDLTSAFTAVVSLAPQLYTGGGTDVLLTPLQAFSIEPLPPGYALLFNGQQIRHRGRAVESGERHLLVWWLR